MIDIYEECPVLETQRFILRLVSEEDAEDLLLCYSDPKSQDIFDSENCTSDFRYKTIGEMIECIQFWLSEYKQRMYIRFSVIDKEKQKPIGTVEMFNSKGFLSDFDGGILRVDLPSRYETTDCLLELYRLANDHFYELFGADIIVTKGRPSEQDRVNALIAAGYTPFDWPSPDRKYYYIRRSGVAL